MTWIGQPGIAPEERQDLRRSAQDVVELRQYTRGQSRIDAERADDARTAWRIDVVNQNDVVVAQLDSISLNRREPRLQLEFQLEFQPTV